jgi:hypothetical protein
MPNDRLGVVHELESQGRDKTKPSRSVSSDRNVDMHPFTPPTSKCNSECGEEALVTQLSRRPLEPQLMPCYLERGFAEQSKTKNIPGTDGFKLPKRK